MISNRIQRARDQHTCDRCGKLIKPGQSYLRQAYRKLDYLKVFSIVRHLDCKKPWGD